MKKLIHDYVFEPSTNTVIVHGIFKPERFLLITNSTANRTIFTFNNPNIGFNSITYNYQEEKTIVVLDFNCSSMSSTDKLQIFVELDYVHMQPSEPFVDPVNKFRVSQPENLIDTDFEYGLQSSKWETLELVKNIPTFFSRNGDSTLPVIAMTITSGSTVVTVQTSSPHNFSVGTPVIVVGSESITADGTFVATKIVDTTTFQYKSKAIQQSTGSILGEFTQVFAGKAYQGTEFDISNVDAVTTNGENPSTLTFRTIYPTKFKENTSVFISNSIGQTDNVIDASLVLPDVSNTVQKDVTNNVATGETQFALGAVQPYNFTGTEAVYFIQGVNTTVNTSTNEITFTSPHGLIDNETYLYVAGELNAVIGGLTTYVGYYVRVVNASTIYLTTTSGGTTRISLTNQGTNTGVMRSAFIRGYRATTYNAATGAESITFNRNHELTENSNQALLFFNGTAGGLSVSTSLHTPGTVYYPKFIRSATAVSFTTTPGGAEINLATGLTATGVMIKAAALQNANSIYFENHGLSTNDNLVFTVQSGTAPGGLVSGTIYKAEPISANRIRFKDVNTQAIINLTSAGTAVSQYRITSKFANLDNDSVFRTNHGLNNGDILLYDNADNTTIPGLINNTNYYVFEATENRFKLTPTANQWLTDARSINQITQVNTATNVITSSVVTGFVTGNFVQYLSTTPIGGLANGAFYYVRAISTTTFSLHWSLAGATGNTDIVVLDLPLAGAGTFRAANLVDITGTSTGIHNFKNISNSATDGVYEIDTVVDDKTYELSVNGIIPLREIVFESRNGVSLNYNAIYAPAHGFATGAAVLYTTVGTPVSGLTSGTTYYVIRVNNKWLRLATDATNAEDGIFISFGTSNPGVGAHRLTTSSISGETLGVGTLTTSAGSNRIIGDETNLSSTFIRGDTLILYKNESVSAFTFTVATATDILTTSAAHGYTTGDLVRIEGPDLPGGLANGNLYYVRVLSATTLTLHTSVDAAAANTSIIDITTVGNVPRNISKITDIGTTFTNEITYVNDISGLLVLNEVPETLTSANYGINTKVLMRSDGFALHRPFDGGVELIPSKNPDSQILRQTRKYFRYQSGKGLQVSFAINFKPSVDIDTISRVGNVATITTRFPHRLTVNLPIMISGAIVSSGINYWNGSHVVTEIVDDFSFNVVLDGVPDDEIARGIIQYYVEQWANAETRCGVFDDQNGMFFSFDGEKLSCARRNSVVQISGTISANFKDSAIVGTNTKFTSQLFENDMIVIKGQSYKVTKIESDTLLYILPSYRGISTTNAIVSKTIDVKVPQTEWNLDKCDGTGRSGYVLDLSRIQMVYIDYAWYGAGKIRFGFKDQRGDVMYVHEFIHNNKLTEAYLRSGNLPARYEIANIGKPSYVPALAHWGTSVIMDGRFDNDESYVFAANSNSLSISGSASVVVSARVETTTSYQIFSGGFFRNAGPALLIATPSPTFNAIATGAPVAGAGLQAFTRTSLPADTFISPRQPYLASVDSRIGNSNNTRATRNLLILNTSPTTVAATPSNYTVTLSDAATPVVYEQPIISIRLAPSVDFGIPGALGQREIINRMQLILDDINILTTHTVQIILKLNGALTSQSWQRVNNPSLSQLMYHSTSDRVVGGTLVYSFRAQGNTGTTGRTPISTIVNLEEVISIGNSILGGDSPYPDGPDVLTVSAVLVEDPSTVTSTNPFNISARLGWKESQA
jgi:hypothetical protein